MKTLDQLLEHDRQRELDGYPRKIKMGKIVKPDKDGKARFVIVPSTIEEKLLHGEEPKEQEEEPEGAGTGEGEVGDIIDEKDPSGEGEGEGEGHEAGQGEGGDHEIESNAYELGKALTEEFELPNLKDKAKKKAVNKYTYDLTDKHRGFGQILDKKDTLKKIVETNIVLKRGNLPDIANVDTTDFIINPQDKIYRILSREKVYESQCLVFLARDYSGSMYGEPTAMAMNVHVMIYSWLLYQYQGHVETRFIVHDTEAKEVPDFHTYYNLSVNGGTQVSSAFKLINKIINDESLDRDYNIYIFYIGDGDCWDTNGSECIPEIRKLLDPVKVSRIGITVLVDKMSSDPVMYKYITSSGLLVNKKEYIKMTKLLIKASESEIITSIKNIIS